MNELQLFNYGEQEIRMVMIDDAPWWVLADVCKALGIVNSRKVAARLDEDEKGVTQSDTLGGIQQMTVVNESGLYSVILRSDKPEAKKFKRWITHEVLPAIRQTGGYALKEPKPPEEELSASAEMQRAGMLIRAAEHKAVPKGEQLRLLSMAVRDLTGKEIDFSAPKEPQRVTDIMKLPEVICCIEKGAIRCLGGCINIRLYSLLEVAAMLGVEPEAFNRLADNIGLKKDGRCGLWERVATSQGEAREFVYRQKAIQRYREVVG